MYLKFPTIDKGKVLLSKIDIARTFRNLHVDPADAFKFGIKWQNKYYLDILAAFSWVHGSATFQLTSDAISDAMRCQGRHIVAYMILQRDGDYILVSTAELAHSQFEDISALITDLGLFIRPARVFVNHILATFRNHFTER